MFAPIPAKRRDARGPVISVRAVDRVEFLVRVTFVAWVSFTLSRTRP